MNQSGPELYQRAKQIIPGGTQLLTKRPEMFLPDRWPSYYRSASGVEVCDLDGNTYIDMSYNGIGACLLGYADPDVNAAVHEAVDVGSMCTLNCPEEVELAELLCELHPWVQMVRYARTGGEAMAVAVRIARAHTRRDKIAFCGYHGWHDWYLSANLTSGDALDGHLLSGLEPTGVPSSLQGTAHPFRYNDLHELEAIVKAHGESLAAIVMEPCRSYDPASGFLEGVRKIADTIGAVLVFDEITTGFRFTTGGAHLNYDVNPDLAVFGKAISNGYAMAAIVGRRDVMEAAQNSFISSTYWTERIGPAAALATVRKLRQNPVVRHLHHIGSQVQQGWQAAALQSHLSIHVSGFEPLAHFDFDHPESAVLHTLFVREMLKRGYLASASFYATFAHQSEHVEAYLGAIRETFGYLRKAVESNNLFSYLDTPVAHRGFQRLT